MCTSWHTDRYIDSLFRVDEPVPDDFRPKTLNYFHHLELGIRPSPLLTST